MLIVTGILLILYLVIRFGSMRANNELQKTKNAYWKREREANETRRKDVSSLDYIKIPTDSLPFIDTQDNTLQSIQHSIMELSKVSILNLSNQSNTDLKLKYGAANLNFLSECDTHYTSLINTLYKWGQYLYEHGDIENALIVLEYGIQCATDISKHYILLATIYKEQNTIDKIDYLLDYANKLDSLMKNSILTALKEIKNSIYLV